VLLAASILAGCGTAAYEERMTARKTDLDRLSKFEELLDPKHYCEITGVDQSADPPATVELGVKLRTPPWVQENKDSLRRMGWRDRHGLAIDPDRIQPPFVKLPGFRFSCEMFVLDEDQPTGMNREKPVYCYFAVSEVAEGNAAEDVVARLTAELRPHFPGAKENWDDAWEEIELDTPTSEEKVKFKRISLQGPQKFDCTPKNGEYKNFKGRFDLYLYSDDRYHVLAGWRAPDAIAQQMDFFRKAEVAMGTLVVRPAESSSKKDDEGDPS